MSSILATKHILHPDVSHTLSNISPTGFIKKYLPGSVVISKQWGIVFDYKNYQYVISSRRDKGTFSANCIPLDYPVEDQSYEDRCSSLTLLMYSYSEFMEEPPAFFADTLKEAVYGLVSFIYADHNIEEFHTMLSRSSTLQYD